MPVPIPTLLAKNGPNRSYATKLGAIFHIDFKDAARIAINQVFNHFKPVAEYKEKNGWIKDHIAADVESFEFVANLMMHPVNVNTPALSAWKDKSDANYQMLRKLFLIKASVQDEDSFYDMIELVRMKWIHEHWDRYEKSAEQAYQILNFPNFYKDLIAAAEPLPLDDGSDIDEDKIDYVAMERKIVGDKNGME